jgi:Xaa-Pro aminopeptidase
LKRGLILWDKRELPQEEFQSRIDKVKNLMSSKKLDAVLIYGDANQSSNLSYLTNFIPYADTGIFIMPLSGSPRLFTTHAYRNMPWFRTITWVEDIICTNYMGEECLKYLRSIVLSEKKIGLIHTRALPYPDFELFQNQLNWEFLDVTDEFEYLRAIKSKYELNFINEASNIAKESFKKLNHILRPGISGFELAAEVELFGRQQGAEDLFCYIQPDNSAQGLTLPTSQQIKHHCSIELSIEYKGYWTKMGRTLVAEKSAEISNAPLEKFSRICQSATDLLRSGQKPLEFCQSLKGRLARVEGTNDSMIYFNLGLEPYWSTHLNDNLSQQFEKNMVLYLKVLMTFKDELNLLQTDTYLIQEDKSLHLTSL